MTLPISSAFSAFAGQKIHQAKVLFYLPVDSGADNLDRDLLTRMQLCDVYLAHRSRCDGFFVEFGEDLVQRALEFAFDNRLDLPEGNGRHHVLELFEFGYVFGRENVGAGAHELPQLHETRPQFLQHQPDAAGRREPAAQKHLPLRDLRACFPAAEKPFEKVPRLRV